MNGYTRFPLKTKLEMMKMYTEKSISISVIAAKFNVRKDTLKHWIRKYKAKGIDALKPNQANKRKFSIDFKKEVVKLVMLLELGLNGIILLIKIIKMKRYPI